MAITRGDTERCWLEEENCHEEQNDTTFSSNLLDHIGTSLPTVRGVEAGESYIVGWPSVSWWTWARWPSRSKIMMSSAGPSMAANGVRRHGGELGGLAGLDGDLALAERQSHPPLDDEEPVVTGVDPLRRCPAGSVRAAS